MDVKPKDIRFYYTQDGFVPYTDWYQSIKDGATKDIIDARLTRLAKGLLGDTKYVGFGFYELRIHFGQGYRIYFGQKGDALIILLTAGEKSSQTKDIIRAHHYWIDYNRRFP